MNAKVSGITHRLFYNIIITVFHHSADETAGRGLLIKHCNFLIAKKYCCLLDLNKTNVAKAFNNAIAAVKTYLSAIRA